MCGKIEEGRVAILIDGTPNVIVLPHLFLENFQSLDDYANRPFYAAFTRVLKPVSYTHLDVYKRQPFERRFHFCILHLFSCKRVWKRVKWRKEHSDRRRTNAHDATRYFDGLPVSDGN